MIEWGYDTPNAFNIIIIFVAAYAAFYYRLSVGGRAYRRTNECFNGLYGLGRVCGVFCLIVGGAGVSTNTATDARNFWMDGPQLRSVY